MLRLFVRRTHSFPQLGNFELPEIHNEPMADYPVGSTERELLRFALADLKKDAISAPFKIPLVINGEEVSRSFYDEKIHTSNLGQQVMPFDHSKVLSTYSNANDKHVSMAIEKALAVKPAWEAMPFADRAAIFLKAADLLSKKYKYHLMAATMLGQAKNVWQAEIDAAAELCDFWRFNCVYAAEMYSTQPPRNSPTTWNRVEYRPLEGFVVAYSPFNFTAIGGNLVSAPALMGNVVIWKPSPSAMYSNYVVYNILKEAGLPDGVIQFLPGDAELITKHTFNHPEFAGLHFTGSTQVFKMLWKKIGDNLDTYKSYPRIVGETGGKNMHFILPCADVENAALQTVRGAFEYSGQKCSATSRVYVPDNLWEKFESAILREHSNFSMGPVDDFSNNTSAVINEAAYDKITGYLNDIKSGKNKSTKIIAGGRASNEVGYYVEPTILLTKDPKAPTMVQELFGPVLTIYVYPENKVDESLELADSTSPYALTCGLFGKDRLKIVNASYKLRNAAGNFYINDKSTGAIVGQQPFGGGRQSGTNDKAGFGLNLHRWVSPRTIKETFVPIKSVGYPSNQRAEDEETQRWNE